MNASHAFCLTALLAFAASALAQSAPPASTPPAPTLTLRTGQVEIQNGPDDSKAVSVSPAAGQPAPNVYTVQLMVHPEMVQAAYLGVALAPADASLQSQLNLPEGVGLVVMGLIPQGPADAAGLKEHDVIKLLDDQIVVNPNQFEVLIRMHNPGDTIDLTVIRQAHQLHVKALLVQHQVPELSWIIGGMPALSGQGTVTLTVPNDNQTPGK